MIITALCAFLSAGLLSGVIPGRLRSALIIALVLFELGNVTDSQLATADRAKHPYLYKLSEHFDLAAFVRGRGEPARIVYDNQAIPYNIGDWYGLEALNAYAASVPAALWKHPLFSARVQDILGVRYYFEAAPERSDLQEVFQGRSGLKVFENAKAFPRTWSVHNVAAGDWATLADPKFDARHSVFLVGEKPPVLQACDGDEVWMPQHHPNDVTIRAAMNCRGMVILTDSWFPGWNATVDGHAAQIEKAYGAFRGVIVEAGDHTIEMHYRPWSVYLGGVFTLLACCVAWFAFRS